MVKLVQVMPVAGVVAAGPRVFWLPLIPPHRDGRPPAAERSLSRLA